MPVCTELNTNAGPADILYVTCIWIEVQPVRYQELDAAGERERVIGYLAQNTNAMVNVFRHRLETLQRVQEVVPMAPVWSAGTET
ncbi:hypothetical protein [Massilia sp. TWR1-2-2]|uniref:hypothetical protein n=1 Tax=Massilia sp. TWR1-2-2 TaxID=2804584 RepID=UPI003CF3B8D1